MNGGMDLTKYLTNATVTQEAQGTTQEFGLKLDFEITDLTELKNMSGKKIATYQLPVKLIPNTGQHGTLLDKGFPAGTYEISDSGLVTLYFNDNYVTAEAEKIEGGIEFFATTQKQYVDDDDKLRVNFDTEDNHPSVVIDINKELFSKHDVTVKKNCTSVNKTDDGVILNYTVEVSTKEGTGKELTFQDVLSDTSVELEYSSVSVTKQKLENDTWQDKGAVTTDITETENGKLNGTLPKLSANEKYLVTYSVKRSLTEADGVKYMNNSATVENDYVKGNDGDSEKVARHDLSIEKQKTGDVVIDRAAGTMTYTYEIKVSSEFGSNGDITLSDDFTVTSDNSAVNLDNVTKAARDVSIKKFDKDGNPLQASGTNVYADNSTGAPKGTLPELKAGEYYVITYKETVSNLPENSQVTLNVENKAKVKDGNPEVTTTTTDHPTWTGSGYVNWIEKTGNYDKDKKIINWEITLNKGAYGNLNGYTLSDVMQAQNLSFKDVQNLVIYDVREDGGWTALKADDFLNADGTITFTNGKTVTNKDNEQSKYALNTGHEFHIKYSTTGAADTKNFFGSVSNTAHIGKGPTDDHPTDHEVEVPGGSVEKKFKGSEPLEKKGNVLHWETALDVPENGLAEESYITDKIEGNGQHWFTKELLQNLKLTIDGEAYTGSYSITVLSAQQSNGNWMNNRSLDSMPKDSKIYEFRVTFNEKVPGNASAVRKLVMEYDSYTEVYTTASNDATYHEGSRSVSGRAYGHATNYSLVAKYNSDGSKAIDKELSAWKRSDLGEDVYLMPYKLVINEGHSSTGTITVTDTIGEGMSFYTEKDWKGADYALKDGIYFYYNNYDGNQTDFPHNMSYENSDRLYTPKGGNQINYGPVSKLSGENEIRISKNGKQLEITIPEGAYCETVDGQTISHSMVIYYAVKIDPSVISKGETYVHEFVNTVTATNGKTKTVDDVTNKAYDDFVTKFGSADALDETFDYVVEINKKEAQLLENASASNAHTWVNPLVITDTFSYGNLTSNGVPVIKDVSLPPDMLKLEKWNGSDWVDADNEILSKSLEKQNGNAVLTVEIGDGVTNQNAYKTHYRLKYTYEFVYTSESKRLSKIEGTVTNSVRIHGAGSEGNNTSTETELKRDGSVAHVSRGFETLTLYKTASDNALNLLPDAVFEVERYNGEEWLPVVNPGESFVTKADGSLAIGTKYGEDTYYVAVDDAYRIREIKAPEGYRIHPGYMYFLLEGGTKKIVPTGWDTLEEYQKNMIQIVGDKMYVSDEPSTDDSKMDIVIRKNWQDKNHREITNPKDLNGVPVEEIKVQLTASYKDENGNFVELYQKTDGSWTKERVDQNRPLERATIEVSLTPENHWMVTREIPKNFGDYPLYYNVEEEDIPSGWAVEYALGGEQVSSTKKFHTDTEHSVIEVTNIQDQDTTSVDVYKYWQQPDGDFYETAPRKSADVTLKRNYYVSENSAGQKSDTYNLILKFQGTEVGRRTGLGWGSQVDMTVLHSDIGHLSAVLQLDGAFSGEELGYTSLVETNPGSEYLSEEHLSFYMQGDVVVNINSPGYHLVNNSFDESVKVTAGKLTEGMHLDKDFAQTVILSDNSDWHYKWAALPITDEAGNMYSYFVEESMPGFVTTIYKDIELPSTGAPASNSVYFRVYNRRLENYDTHISVKKIWKYAVTDPATGEVTAGDEITKKDFAYKDLSDVTLQLYRTTDPNAVKDPKFPENCSLISTVTVGEEQNWKYTWRDRDQYQSVHVDENGQTVHGDPFYYYVWETIPGTDYRILYDDTKKQATVTNSKTGESYTVLYDQDEPETNTDSKEVIPQTEYNSSVTNLISKTTVSAEKKWYDAEGNVMKPEDIKGEIEVQLYRMTRNTAGSGFKEEAIGDPVILSAKKDGQQNYTKNGWRYTWENLTAGTYFIRETVNDGYSTTYQAGQIERDPDEREVLGEETNIPTEAALTEGTIYIKNQEKAVEITANKTWETGLQQRDIEVELYQSRTKKLENGKRVELYQNEQLIYSAYVNTESFDLNLASNNWTTEPEVISVSGAGARELRNVDGVYTWRITNARNDIELHLNDSTALYDLTNRINSDGIKIISNDSGTIVPIDSILYDTQTLGTKNKWTYHWEDLPSTDDEGEPVYYYIREKDYDHLSFHSTYSYEYSEDGRINVVNIHNEEGRTAAITARKVWLNSDGSRMENVPDKTIKVYLCRGLKDKNGKIDESTVVIRDTGYLNKDNNWTVIWDELIKADESGNIYWYYVEEEDISGYKITYSNDPKKDPVEKGSEASLQTGELTVYNTEEKAEFTVKKEWKDGSGNTDPNHPGKVGVQLYRTTPKLKSNAAETAKITVVDSSGNVWIPATETGSGALLKLPDVWDNTNITLEASEGLAVTREASESAPNWDKGDKSFGLYLNFRLTFEEPGSYILKVSNYSSNADKILIPAEAVGKTNVDITEEMSMGPDYHVYLSDKNGWQYKWDDLEKIDKDGNLYFYYVAEDSVIGYKASYEYKVRDDKTIESAVITNTKDTTDAQTSVKVNKSWDGYKEDEIEDYIVHLTLRQKGTDDEGQEIVVAELMQDLTSADLDKAKKTWSYTWENLPDGYKYEVVETSVTDADGNEIKNFETTYSENNNTVPTKTDGVTPGADITVTNTKKGQGVLLPGTGSKYPIIFYALGLAFLASSAIAMPWAYRRKTKKNTGGGG
ncbi:MAG: Cna B-type domain-containing protein [Eubacteriales bacterium]|nr:Cna B-type domain-containing protein [Eubacteriales bacterium]